MDAALVLRLAVEDKKSPDGDEVTNLLKQSKLVTKLTKDFVDNPLFIVFRLLGLSEIPFTQDLPYTQKLLSYVNENIATPQGFSCLGGVAELVPCYNALLLEAYCRFGLADCKEAKAALNWIKTYQLFERGSKTTWQYKGVCKHGGCLGNIPCYIGIGKTIRALITYSESVNHTDDAVEELIGKGITYMLRHNMYQRLSDGAPISAHITDIMMPQSYALSLTDLAYIAGKRKLTDKPECASLMKLIKSKQIFENQWKIDYRYTYRGYVGFETKTRASNWISGLFPLWLS
ncbi:MAG: hypothetical protein PHO29_13765 [Acetobacterium sp.]|nr:hypothetical protein [Acetobacterium sp.]